MRKLGDAVTPEVGPRPREPDVQENRLVRIQAVGARAGEAEREADTEQQPQSDPGRAAGQGGVVGWLVDDACLPGRRAPSMLTPWGG